MAICCSRLTRTVESQREPTRLTESIWSITRSWLKPETRLTTSLRVCLLGYDFGFTGVFLSAVEESLFQQYRVIQKKSFQQMRAGFLTLRFKCPEMIALRPAVPR